MLKTPAMREVEERLKLPLEQAMVDALNERNPDGTARSMAEAADAIDVPRSTFRLWMALARIEYEQPLPVARLAKLAG